MYDIIRRRRRKWQISQLSTEYIQQLNKVSCLPKPLAAVVRLIILIGRGYSGGLLAFTPSAVRKLRIPMRMAEQLDFQKIDDWQRKGEIDEILEYTDSILLREGLGLTDDEIKTLHDIWDKMRNRRLSRNKK